uniref:Odorant receptor 52 n=1 Tax=Eucryptorrhynchus scrobiculatus TaxID=1552824 RepID=A0A8F2JGI0_EUCSC|nr:odorant receptor 52 [Eucryptorrhynchus scrobiculatus]
MAPANGTISFVNNFNFIYPTHRGSTTTSKLGVFSIVMMILLQIFVLGWCANEICHESVGVANAICASDWYEQSEKVKKLLIIMIMRAQKPIGITAGPFFLMTTGSALMTLKFAYSYMSLMIQNYEN